ncbi:MAG: phage holin family protein [Actinobacteria bacterium]|nr:phage holin family protein [Actinomycetota bacterium]MCA1697667.1 phage holin family protein [Actinomycetota bacterium]
MPGYADDDPRDRPVGELLKQLAEQTSTLVKQQLELAKAEMAQKGKQAGLRSLSSSVRRFAFEITERRRPPSSAC